MFVCLIVCPLRVPTVISVLVSSSTSAILSQLVCLLSPLLGVTVLAPPLPPVGLWSMLSFEGLGTQRKMRCHGFTHSLPLNDVDGLQSAGQVDNAHPSLLRPLRQQKS